MRLHHLIVDTKNIQLQKAFYKNLETLLYGSLGEWHESDTHFYSYKLKVGFRYNVNGSQNNHFAWQCDSQKKIEDVFNKIRTSSISLNGELGHRKYSGYSFFFFDNDMNNLEIFYDVDQ